MAVSLRQVWENLEVTVRNDYATARGFLFNFCYAPIEPYKPRVTFQTPLLKGGEAWRNIYDYSLVRREWQKYGDDIVPGTPVMVELVEWDAPNARVDVSNTITYQAWAVPIEVIGAGLGAVIGGVVGYVLKPLGPEVSALIGVGLGGGGGYGLAYVATTGIPEIPIPTFGATPEGPGAPMRLGKYLITG